MCYGHAPISTPAKAAVVWSKVAAGRTHGQLNLVSHVSQGWRESWKVDQKPR